MSCKAWKEVQVKKLNLTKKALEEPESHVDELRKVLLDNEREITTLREQVHRAKADEKVEFQDFDDFLVELRNCYSDGFNECLCQVKALHPILNVSLVSLDNVVQTLARIVDIDEVFKAGQMPNVQDNREAAFEDRQVKSVGDKTCPIMEENKPARHDQVVDEEVLVDQP